MLHDNGFVVLYTGGLATTIDRRRERMGLPKLVPPNLEEVDIIMKETGIGNLIEKTLDNKEDEK